ncbi:hypothetical protein [Xanthovirga aplysinae]|uniref:hypothetical protein n=1 Tax=Xanthovirga aplysinae TaxID=2529853 RepID=UPI0012BC02D7|nr:hypothetical protein [Xanthovirga aplysinae]MTI32695.1 hypothetical protein [Xanthovirga aplysinae]
MERGGSDKMRINNIRHRIDEIKDQLENSRQKAVNSLENEKMKFRNSLNEAQKQINEIKKQSYKEGEKLQREFDDLNVQLALGKAETLEAITKQKNQIDQSYSRLKADIKGSLKKAPQSLKVALRKYIQKLEDEKEELDARLELQRLRFADEKKELGKKYVTKKEQIEHDLENIENRINDSWGQTKEKIGHIADEITKKYESLRKRINK